jgi:hypothetical protein
MRYTFTSKGNGTIGSYYFEVIDSNNLSSIYLMECEIATKIERVMYHQPIEYLWTLENQTL